MASRMEKALQEVSEFFFLANAKVAQAESLGIDFPNGCLYTMFRSFDIVSTIDEVEPGEDASKIMDECVDQASAMLLSAYVYASLAIGSYYYKQAKAFEAERKDVRLGKYHDYDALKVLREKRSQARRVAASFGGGLTDSPDGDLLQIYYEIEGLSCDERIEYLHDVDRWSSSFAGLCKAQEEALFVYEKAGSAQNKMLSTITWVIRVLSLFILVPSLCGIAKQALALLA